MNRAEEPDNFLAAPAPVPDFFQAAPASDFFPGGFGSWYLFLMAPAPMGQKHEDPASALTVG